MKKIFKPLCLTALMLGAVACSDNDSTLPLDPDEVYPYVEIKNAKTVNTIPVGTSAVFDVNAANVARTDITTPLGWTATYANGKLTVTAPAAVTSACEQTGIVTLGAYSVSNLADQTSITVSVHAMNVLTFEDADAKFTPYPLDYCNKTISKWSDLIDTPQYGGPLLYGSGAGMDSPLYWYDQNNTELFHVFPEAFGTYCYWSGGHAISNYAGDNIKDFGGYEQQLTVFSSGTAGGHNGSKNFAMHNGYMDGSQYCMLETLPALEFYDGQAHIIDHMWVTNGTYALNSYINGTAYSPAAGPSDWVKIIATGTHADGSTAQTEFYLLKNGEPVINWTMWNLSVLGAVVGVEFNLTGSSDNGYGFSQPSYFAYDDVAVRK